MILKDIKLRFAHAINVGSKTAQLDQYTYSNLTYSKDIVYRHPHPLCTGMSIERTTLG